MSGISRGRQVETESIYDRRQRATRRPTRAWRIVWEIPSPSYQKQGTPSQTSWVRRWCCTLQVRLTSVREPGFHARFPWVFYWWIDRDQGE